jgi:hypothetical protein
LQSIYESGTLNKNEDIMAKNKILETAKPQLEEQTKEQVKGGVTGLNGESPFSSSGTFSTYRKMRGNPTIALARMVATSPLRTASLSFESDDDTNDEVLSFVQGEIERLWPRLIKDTLFALDYGYVSFEKVWDVRNGRYIYKKLKPLIPDKTEILIDKDDGGFAGLKQESVVLPPEKCFLFTCDGEAGEFHGRSRYENIRENAWNPWMDIAKQLSKFVSKVAGVTPLIEYPEGVSLDSSGQEVSNFDMAKRVLEKLGNANGVAMPNVFAKYANELAKSGVDLGQLKAWKISFLETSGQHAAQLTNTLRYYDSLLMRGWLVPERSAIEGQFGTKADAETHGDIVLLSAELLLDDILRDVNEYIVLVYNFGQDYAGRVKVKQGGIDPAMKAFYQKIIESVLTNPANIDLLVGMTDLDAMLDNVGIPKAAEIVNAEEIRKNKQTPPADALSRAVKQIYKGIYHAA